MSGVNCSHAGWLNLSSCQVNLCDKIYVIPVTNTDIIHHVMQINASRFNQSAWWLSSCLSYLDSCTIISFTLDNASRVWPIDKLLPEEYCLHPLIHLGKQCPLGSLGGFTEAEQKKTHCLSNNHEGFNNLLLSPIYSRYANTVLNCEYD